MKEVPEKERSAESGENRIVLKISRSNSDSLAKLPDESKSEAECGAKATVGEYVVYLNDQNMGQGDARLGELLMKGFLKTLPELDALPETIIFVNSAVRLLVSGSRELAAVKSLADSGCTILVCGTCLDFYNLKDQLEVGVVSNMFEIASLLTGSKKV